MRIVFTLLFITSLSLFSFSQTNKAAFYCGINFSKWTDDANRFAKDLANEMVTQGGFSEFQFKNQFKLGFSIGVNMEFPISGNVSFQPGIFYSQKGTEFNGDGKFEGIYLEEKVRMITDYIEIPLILRLNLLYGKNKLFLISGPAIGLLMKSKIKVTAKALGNSETDTDDLENCLYRHLSIIFGAGIDFNNKIRTEIKYDAGLSSIIDKDKDDGYIMKNGVISICLAYIINN